MQQTVLVIDDSRMIREIYRQKLAQEKFHVLVAAGGLEALQILARETPDVILLDLLMPDVDGFQLLEMLKREPRLKRVPVLVLSGKSHGEDLQRALALGAADYIVKATTPPNEVIRHIAKALAAGHPGQRKYRLGLDPLQYDAPALAADFGFAGFKCRSCGAPLVVVLEPSEGGWAADLACSACARPHPSKEEHRGDLQRSVTAG